MQKNGDEPSADWQAYTYIIELGELDLSTNSMIRATVILQTPKAQSNVAMSSDNPVNGGSTAMPYDNTDNE